VGAKCQIRGYVSDTLDFTLIGEGEAGATRPADRGNSWQTAVLKTGYDDTWYISRFWSGEYPPGFSVTAVSETDPAFALL
jgi:hypothetical protein